MKISSSRRTRVTPKKGRLRTIYIFLGCIATLLVIITKGPAAYKIVKACFLPPPQHTDPIPTPILDIELTCFTCNYWKDLNNDTQMNWPKEFFGIKEIFFYHKDIELMVVAHIEKGKNKSCKKEIVTPTGLVYAAHSNILSSNSIHLYSEHKVGELIDEGGEGYWKINYYFDSVLFKVDSFALYK